MSAAAQALDDSLHPALRNCKICDAPGASSSSSEVEQGACCTTTRMTTAGGGMLVNATCAITPQEKCKQYNQEWKPFDGKTRTEALAECNIKGGWCMPEDPVDTSSAFSSVPSSKSAVSSVRSSDSSDDSSESSPSSASSVQGACCIYKQVVNPMTGEVARDRPECTKITEAECLALEIGSTETTTDEPIMNEVLMAREWVKAGEQVCIRERINTNCGYHPSAPESSIPSDISSLSALSSLSSDSSSLSSDFSVSSEGSSSSAGGYCCKPNGCVAVASRDSCPVPIQETKEACEADCQYCCDESMPENSCATRMPTKICSDRGGTPHADQSVCKEECGKGASASSGKFSSARSSTQSSVSSLDSSISSDSSVSSISSAESSSSVPGACCAHWVLLAEDVDTMTDERKEELKEQIRQPQYAQAVQKNTVTVCGDTSPAGVRIEKAYCESLQPDSFRKFEGQSYFVLKAQWLPQGTDMCDAAKQAHCTYEPPLPTSSLSSTFSSFSSALSSASSSAPAEPTCCYYYVKYDADGNPVYGYGNDGYAHTYAAC
ncbi:MAG: hypothetical protein WC112_09550, partial [Proteiniphilum sp.]